MITKNKRAAFTIVELLTVLLIITLLIALLIPALSTVRKMAKETQQQAQLTTIELALTAFKNDYGDYPPSNDGNSPSNYTGAQTLAEALVGYDLLGFHPDSKWDETDSSNIYDSSDQDNLKERLEPYLELATTNVFRIGDSSASEHDGLFDDVDPGGLEGDTHVLCDVFTVRRITINTQGDIVKAGTPILYYRANTANKSLDPNTTPDPKDMIYNYDDNLALIDLGSLTADGSDTGKEHPIAIPDGEALYKPDYDGGITDSKITEIPWPHRPDSYILISAGADGLYGTKDDIRNF